MAELHTELLQLEMLSVEIKVITPPSIRETRNLLCFNPECRMQMRVRIKGITEGRGGTAMQDRQKIGEGTIVYRI